MKKTKTLYAIHRDTDYNLIRTKMAEGTTADFAAPIGFVIYDEIEIDEKEADSDSVPGGTGLNGSYPVMIGDRYSNLEGKLLTLADMTFTNKEQREAFKSVTRQTLWDFFSLEVNEMEQKFHNTTINK
jgi:hypothetical protein